MTARKNSSAPTGAFTLIELLIAMAIIAVLASFAFISGQSSLRKSRDAKRKSDLSSIADALELFHNDYGIYPAANGGRISACPYNSSTGNGTACTWGSGRFADDRGSVYHSRLPDDPLSTQNYIYAPSADRSYFLVYADFEQPNDPDSQNLGCTGTACAGHDYFVASPNAPI